MRPEVISATKNKIQNSQFTWAIAPSQSHYSPQSKAQKAGKGLADHGDGDTSVASPLPASAFSPPHPASSDAKVSRRFSVLPYGRASAVDPRATLISTAALQLVKQIARLQSSSKCPTGVIPRMQVRIRYVATSEQLCEGHNGLGRYRARGGEVLRFEYMRTSSPPPF